MSKPTAKTKAEQNGCRQRLVWHLSCHWRFSLAVACFGNAIYVYMKYKVILWDLVSSSGLFGKTPSLEVANSMTEMINALAGEGWELVAVAPVTDDGSPAQIRQAYHYFRKLA